MGPKKVNKAYKTIPGTIIECQSGRYLAYYEHRTDIIANGDSEIEAKKNLKTMYEIVMEFEASEEKEPPANTIDPSKIKHFTQKITTPG